MRFPISFRRGTRLLTPSTISFNFTATIHLRGQLTLEMLESAFTRLTQRHPLIGSHVILIPDEQAFLTDENTLPVTIDIVPRQSEETWITEVDRILQAVFDYRTGPLLRCIWIQGNEYSDLVLVIDHGTADGRSGMFAVRDLMALLGDTTLELPKIMPIRMAEAITPVVARRVEALEAAAPIDSPPGAIWSPQLSTESRTITAITLDIIQTSTLIDQCHQEGVSVQSALCAAFLMPFAERNPETPLRLVEVPVDLRPYLQQPTEDWYGSFISLAVISVDCTVGLSLWNIAKNAQAALKAINIEDLFFVPPAVFQIANRMPPPKMFDTEYDLSISNLGRWDIPNQIGSLELLGVHAPTFNVIMPNHRVLGVTTCSGRLCGTYTARDPQAPALAARGLELLLKMIE